MIIFKYTIINGISSYGTIISEYNVKQRRWSEIPNIDCFFNWPIESVEKTDFVQLIQACQMRLTTHFDKITHIRVKVESVWHIVT